MSSSDQKEEPVLGDSIVTENHHGHHSNDVDMVHDTEYPTGWRFYAILIAIILTMLLVKHLLLLIGLPKLREPKLREEIMLTLLLTRPP